MPRWYNSLLANRYSRRERRAGAPADLSHRTGLIFTLTIWSLPAAADDKSAPNTIFGYVVSGSVALAIVIGLGAIRSALSGSAWSLSDALSEEADISPLDRNGVPVPGPDGKPQIISELRASSSRLIAPIGLVGILVLYLGFGLVILKGYATDGTLPPSAQIDEIAYLLFAGVTMFAPYVVNKFSSVFDWLTPAKR